MFKKYSRRVAAVLLESLNIAIARIFINGGVLIKLLILSVADKAGCRNKLNVYLNTLTGEQHFLVGLGYILWIFRFDRHLTMFYEYAVKTGYRACISAFTKFYPEYDQSIVGIAPPHIEDKLRLGWRVLVGVAVRLVGLICEGLQCPVIAFSPAVDVLAVYFIPDCRLCCAMFKRIFN